MWERFSYYGMRALLVLFMVDAVRQGGMGLSDQTATAIYGLYTAAVYLAALPGGWVADRFIGAQRSVWYGGIIIACGHFTLAIPSTQAFYLGLLLVVMGTGLLKPNVSAMVGDLYPEGGASRDAGFSIFYMGINLGALLGPLVCSALGEKVNWHYGFAAAGVGMVAGLAQYGFSRKHLGEAGRSPGHHEGVGTRDWLLLAVLLLGIITIAGLSLSGFLQIDAVALAGAAKYLIAGVGVLYFVIVFLFFDLDPTEKRRVAAIVILLLASAMFWAGLEQAGSSLNLFAERYTQRVFMGVTIPSGWFQALAPLFVISLAPVAASVWLALGRRNLDPSIPAKFAWGLLLLAGGFLVMALASRFVAAGQKVWPTWLITTYLLHTLGELCLSPIGLSSVTKLAPKRLVGQLMGAWFLATSLGNLIAGLIAGSFSAEAVQQMPRLYLQIVLTTASTGLVLLIFSRPIKSMMKSSSP
jgi:POT family proton-dependent oligopeptide transporter